MTWTIKQRPRPNAPMLAEYECPVHGRFELLVERDTAGDPPSEVVCPFKSWSVAGGNKEYASYEAAAEVAIEAGYGDPATASYETQWCGDTCPWRISAPSLKRDTVPCYAAARGGDTDRRPGMLDTRSLAEGGSVKEWKAKQQAARHERRHHELIKKGLKTRRVQV